MKSKMKILAGILLAGVLYSWTNVIISFSNFYKFEGTIFKIRDCYFSNPVLTPCFWGATAFVVAFAWSVMILRLKDEKKVIVNQQRLTYLLAFGTVFAFSVFAKEVFDLYRSETGQIQTCLGSIDNPLKSSCLYGGLIYLISFIYSLRIKNGD